MPVEYAPDRQEAASDWKPTDVIATASLIGGIFGRGGGGEVDGRCDPAGAGEALRQGAGSADLVRVPRRRTTRGAHHDRRPVPVP